MEKEKIKCPYCGYEMPIYRSERTVARELYVRCKARHCHKVFEIKIEPERADRKG